MKEINRELDRKIKQLEKLQGLVESKVRKGISLEKNTAALKQVVKSLSHAKDARAAGEESCCNHSCNINYDE